jgi:23S rRNA (guanosine2251-2'-O)-methyltransferase
VKNPGNKPRAGAVRKTSTGKQVGSGGQGRQALEGKKPTPKAVDRPYHPAGKRKAAAERFEAAGGRKPSRGKEAPGAEQRPQQQRRAKSGDEVEVVTGRNSVLEALRANIPAQTLYMATRIEYDDRVKEVVKIATTRGIPVLEVMRPELDRLAGFDSVHQGLALKVPPYEYAHPMELLEKIEKSGRVPLPVGLTASAWKTSAGAAARTPVAMASNLNATIKAYKERGVFVLGLAGDGEVSLPDLALAKEPVLLVIGSEGKGLSRLVTENCDAVVSIPINASTESLNAGIAASVALYEVSRLRAAAKKK